MAANTLCVVAGPRPSLAAGAMRSWPTTRAGSPARRPGAGPLCRQDALSPGRCGLRARRADAAGQLALRFDAPQWAVTPGQSAVLYDGEVCLGGGDDRVVVVVLVVLVRADAARRAPCRRWRLSRPGSPHDSLPPDRKPAMYLPAHFAESRPEVMQQLMREHPFGLLVTRTPTTSSATACPSSTTPAPARAPASCAPTSRAPTRSGARRAAMSIRWSSSRARRPTSRRPGTRASPSTARRCRPGTT